MNDPSAPGSGWFPDPAGRFDLRWFNGRSWTGDVSVGGQRFVDPVPPGQFGPSPGAGDGGSPKQTMAVLALIAGLVAVTTTWMPLVVAVGALAAIGAIVLAGVALSRISKGRAAGRGMAIAGLVLGIVAVALVPVGVILTGRVVDELVAFAEPGPVEVEIETCRGDGGRLEVLGSIRNESDRTRSYVVLVELSDIRGRDDVAQVEVTDVAPGDERPWSLDERSDLDGELRCSVEVTGPFPFGISPPDGT